MLEAVVVQLGNFFGTFITYDSKNNSSIWKEYMRLKVRCQETIEKKEENQTKERNRVCGFL